MYEREKVWNRLIKKKETRKKHTHANKHERKHGFVSNNNSLLSFTIDRLSTVYSTIMRVCFIYVYVCTNITRGRQPLKRSIIILLHSAQPSQGPIVVPGTLSLSLSLSLSHTHNERWKEARCLEVKLNETRNKHFFLFPFCNFIVIFNTPQVLFHHRHPIKLINHFSNLWIFLANYRKIIYSYVPLY